MQRLKRIGLPRPAMIVSVIALVLALGGAAVASHGHALKLGMFQDSSRDRLAGTGVIQYAAATHTTAAAPSTDVQRFEVKCELSKKATSGGFKWDGTPPDDGDFSLVDAYPTGQGFVVRLRATGASAANKQLFVFANCVKSRKQRGTPPA